MANGNEGRPLPYHLRLQIRRLRLNRIPVREIAQLAGVSHTTVMRYTKDLSARFARERTETTDDRRDGA